LVGNAVKFTPEGHVTITVSENRKSKPPQLRVDVKDSGIGIPKDRIDHIFERFTQAESSTTQKYGGTGLGLAISQKLVALMNGRMGVQSIEGEGSTFWFEIETRFGAAESDLPHAHLSNSHPDAPVPHGTLQKILFVTETPEICVRAAQASLENGYKPYLMAPSESVAAFLNSSDFTQNWQSVVIFDDTSPSPNVQNLIENLNLNPPLLDFQIVYMSDLKSQNCTNSKLDTYLPDLRAVA